MTAGVLFGLLGTALLVVAFVDMLWTTVAASAGAGPITGHVSKGLWDAARGIAGRRDEVSHRPLRLASVVIVLAVFGTWLLLAWTGWTLVFLADADGVVTDASGTPASVTERIYFAGYSMATLGNGEFIPNGTIWQLLTVAATLSGFGLATLGITYLVPVVGAVTDRRAQALHVAALGERPTDIVVQAWDGGGWGPLEHELQQIGPSLSLLGQRHLAYPILHFFHDVDADAAAAVRVAVIDEAVTLLQHGVASDVRPHGFVLQGMRRSVNAYLDALRAAYIAPAEQAPPPPDLSRLREVGIATVDDEEFRRALDDLDERRRTLLGAIQDDGWTWTPVMGAPAGEKEEAPEGIDVEDHRGSDAG